MIKLTAYFAKRKGVRDGQKETVRKRTNGRTG